MNQNPYETLAERLDSLPNGYPSTPDGAELRILEYLFTTEEAELGTKLRMTLETPDEISTRIGGDPIFLKQQLKEMTRKGLIRAGKTQSGGFGYGLLPFVVGIFEYQNGRIDAEFAELFENYYRQSFTKMTLIEPKFHRVIPVAETVRNDMSIEPYESAASIIEGAAAWGVLDCICRVQKSLIGDPCEHPVDICMAFNQRPGAFDGNPIIKALTKDEAYATLNRAADAGLVHSVSNSQDGASYICNCCTCSCGILRGIAETGIANVIARSAFVNEVDPDLCACCETCIDYCQFDALSLRPEDPNIQISAVKCVGCGVCVPQCPDSALSLVRRPEEDILPVLPTHDDWLHERAKARGVDIQNVL
jgi:Pyruvate/2-oxoacid:ferredoxin oxidoreductase delta subunit